MPANHRWILRRRPRGRVGIGDLEYVAGDTRPLQDGDVLVRNIYLSIDPTYRLWMSEQSHYAAPVALGETMRGLVLGVVEASRHPRFRPGDVAIPKTGYWETYTVAAGTELSHVPHRPGLPLSAYLSVLGSAGRAAYFGIREVARPRPGETVVVTAAAGAAGSIAAQIARLEGARVIGIAGGPAKCRWLTDEVGLDGAIDYKNEDVGEALDRLCPQGIDVDFENVGGAIMSAIVPRMNDFGRIAICGLISTYNEDPAPAGPDHFRQVLMRRLTVRGFINGDYRDRFAEAYAAIEAWIAAGELTWRTEELAGLENAVDAVGRLFAGEHDGKLLVRISEPPAERRGDDPGAGP